jgi:two-component system CheB/CheR fusion protein
VIGDILYLHGRSGMFLELAPGEAGPNNILKMAREGLRRELTTTLHKAAGSKTAVIRPSLRVKTNGHYTPVKLTIRPVTIGPGATPEAPLFLVILEEAAAGQVISRQPADVDAPGDTTPDTEKSLVVALKMELRAKEEYLQNANEELESSSEELKSSNEEMQSVNEELQSTNEELETSKEELQSVNEELATVNAELQTKVTDLSRANNDMSNLLAGTGTAIVLVDNQLRILRFTPAASSIINLILTDVGRPIAHIVSNLVGYTTLVADVKAVLETLVAKDLPVQTLDGKNYSMHIQPYRTLDNMIEGAVIAFSDVTEMVVTRDALKNANDKLQLELLVRDTRDAIIIQDLEGRILAWNPGAQRIYGWSAAEAINMNVFDRIPAPLREGALSMLENLSRAEILEPYRTQRLSKTGALLDVSIIASALINEDGAMYAIAITERPTAEDRP